MTGAAGAGETRLELLYAVNPMCSWCYGFLPSVEAMRARFGEAVGMTLVLGALRAETEPMRAERRWQLAAAWTRVAAASGQPFDQAILASDDFAYDTRPPSRAVMAVRALGGAAALDYLAAVQRAFYRDGRRVTERDVLLAIAAEVGLDPTVVDEGLVNGADALERENHDLQALGIGGYPTVVALGARPEVVTVGFMPPDPFVQAVATAVDRLRTT